MLINKESFYSLNNVDYCDNNYNNRNRFKKFINENLIINIYSISNYITYNVCKNYELYTI